MRSAASILHLDLDAFFAAVEQRDKPSLRGKPVIVGGSSTRGVVATASYEARVFGVRSAMSASEARRRCPHAAFLSGRRDAYRASSQVVMGLLRQLSPLVEPLSIDEAFVDLAAGGHDPSDAERVAAQLRADVERLTEGLTASVGIGSSKFIAKVASEMAKPNGLHIVAPGTEVDTIAPLPVRAVPGVGPVAQAKLSVLGIKTVADLQRASRNELVRELGLAWGSSLAELAFARDDRPVVAEREAKSVSTEDTFAVDLTDAAQLLAVIDRDAADVAGRLERSRVFARTITLKVRLADFTTYTRSRTLLGATSNAEQIASVARELLAGVNTSRGVRLLGVGASSFTDVAQEPLIADQLNGDAGEIEAHVETPSAGVLRSGRDWPPGADVLHAEHGRGWVWGSGLGRVTVRFEDRYSGRGPARTFADNDPALTRTDAQPLTAS